MGKFVLQPHVRLQEWVAEERGHFGDEGLDYEFMSEGLAGASRTTSAVRRADDSPVELHRATFEDMQQGRTCDVSAACHWAVNAAATGGAERMWGHAYSVSPAAVFVAPNAPCARPEDLAGVRVAVGHRSGSHYSAIQGLGAVPAGQRHRGVVLRAAVRPRASADAW